MRKLGPTDLKRLHRDWARRATGRVALLLDGVTSPFNVGAIVRTSAAFKVEHLYLAGGATSPSSSKAGKTAMGTERYLSWSTFERGADAADAAREDGFAVVGLELASRSSARVTACGSTSTRRVPASSSVAAARRPTASRRSSRRSPGCRTGSS